MKNVVAIAAHAVHVNVAENKQMKLTKQNLKQIIKEELEAVMNEQESADVLSENMTDVEMGKALFRLIRGSDNYDQIKGNLGDLVKELVVQKPNLDSFRETIERLFNTVNLEFKSKVAEPVEQAKQSAANIQEFNKWKRQNRDLFEAYAALNQVSAGNRVALAMKALINSTISKQKDSKIAGKMSSDWQHHARGKLLQFMSNFADPTASAPAPGSEFDDI
jgi:predicted component of type VI protein secretion system